MQCTLLSVQTYFLLRGVFFCGPGLRGPASFSAPCSDGDSRYAGFAGVGLREGWFPVVVPGGEEGGGMDEGDGYGVWRW